MKRFVLLSVLVSLLATSSVPAVEIVNKAKGKVEEGVYHSLDGAFTIKVPDLGSKQLHILDGVVSPDITHRVMFQGDLGYSAIVVSTKIREEFPKNDLVLQRVGSNQKQEFLQQGGYLEDLQFIGTEEGKILQSVVRYIGIGLPAQVMDTFTKKLVPQRMDIFGVHRYIVRNGFLIEFIIFAPQIAPDEVSSEHKFLLNAFKDSNAFLSGLQIDGKPDARLVELLKEFKPKENYIQYRVKKPVWDKPKS